ncbi:hypothetical protein KC345_g11105, partial [Hortaea werneckii]
MNKAPNLKHWLGTDALGRDILTRVMQAGRISLTVGLASMVLSVFLGSLLGAIAGYYGGLLDQIIMRIADLLMTIPGLPLLFIFGALLSEWKIPTDYRMYIVMLMLSIVNWPGLARMVRGQMLSLREREFMQAAVVLGLRDRRKLFHHLLPNIVPLLIVMATLNIGGAILSESVLSFFGLGVMPPTPTWGNMIDSANNIIDFQDRPWLWIPPGLSIFATVAISMEPLMNINGLSTVFFTDEGKVRAVDNVSFGIREGETVCIVGESGCGKSVTAMSVMGLVEEPGGKVAGGSIDFRGEDLLQLDKNTLRSIRGNEIAMIFQEPMSSLNPVMRIGEQIMEPLIVHLKMNKKQARTRAIELITQVGISRPDKIIDSYPHELSGGMLQRIMIAIAVSCGPKLLIADEPTTALDVTIQAQILDLLRGFKENSGMSILLITHDLGVVAEMADYVIVMYSGKIVEEGGVVELFESPKHPYTRGLLKSKPVMGQRLEELYSIPGQVPNPLELEPSCYFHDRFKSLKKYFPVTQGLLGRTVGHVKAVDDISIILQPGETFGLVGESGSGKSTVGRTILRLTDKTDGEVKFKGVDIHSLSAAELRLIRPQMQLIFQDPYSALNPR